MSIKIKSIYSPRQQVLANTVGKTRTQQNSKAECDINNIMRKYQATGQLPSMIKNNPRYGDFSNVPDYQGAMETVLLAQHQFEALPSRLRERFYNDPARFLEFVSNKENVSEMVKLGLATATPVEAPVAKPEAASKPSEQ